MAPLVLLVLHDAAFRAALMPALRDRGLRVALVPDPEDARAHLASNPVSVAIVEGQLPATSGVEWVRARRGEGIDALMVLCAATKEEQRAIVEAVADLDVSSVVPKGIAPEKIAAHVDDLLLEASAAPAPAEPEPDPDAERIAAALERMRVSIVHLQKNAESMDRILSSLAEAKRLRDAAAGAPSAQAAAKLIADILVETRDGRRRLDGASWTPIERALARAKEDLATGPREVRGRSSSAYTPAEVDAVPSPSPAAAPVSAPQIDELTGVFTAEAFLREAQELADGAAIDERPFSLCVIGVDAAALRAANLFQPVMEALGRFLASRFRPEDVRGRYAVDAFAVGLPGTPASMATATMTRTLEALGSTGIVGADGRPLRVAVGVATFPKDGRDAASTLAVAKRRMETVRAAGGVRGP